MEVLAAVVVGVLVGWSGLVVDLFRDRRTRLRDGRQAAYVDFTSALAGWAHLHQELRTAQEDQDEGLVKELSAAERRQELEVLRPAQAKLRLVAPQHIVEAARATSDELRRHIGRAPRDAWPEYTRRFRGLVSACREDLYGLRRHESVPERDRHDSSPDDRVGSSVQSKPPGSPVADHEHDKP